MASIYDGASQVAAFLGPEDENSTLAIEKMKSLVSLFKLNSGLPLYEFVSWESAELFGDPSQQLDTTAWKAIAKLLNRPWFSRTWIVQEASTRRGVLFICGIETMEWTVPTVTGMVIQETYSKTTRRVEKRLSSYQGD